MVAQIHEVTDDNLKDGEYWFPNLHETRYFFSPSAFGLEKGEGYFGHSYWLLWQAQYGITDELSIGGGTTFWGFPATLNAKYSFNINKDFNLIAEKKGLGSNHGISSMERRSIFI